MLITMIEYWYPSPNYHDGRSSYRLLVFHTTQSNWTWEQGCEYFAQASSKVSAHHTADPFTLGVFGACVDERYCAWTQGNANGECLSLEQCGYAEWDRSTWLGEKYVLVQNAAEWGRTLAAKYDIPLRWLSASQAQDHVTKGLVQHRDLQAWGGNHHNCGDGWPSDVVMQLMQDGSTGGIEVQDVIPGMATFNGKEYYTWLEDGTVMYRGPDTNDQPVCIDSSAGAVAGTNLHITADGWTFVTFTNSKGKPYVDRRPPGGGAWERFPIAGH